MNASPNRWRALATFTILASALLAALAGCTNKTSSGSRRADTAKCRKRQPGKRSAILPLETPRTQLISRRPHRPRLPPLNPRWSFPAAPGCRCV